MLKWLLLLSALTMVAARASQSPGGVLTTSYGTLLVSDDTGSVIYRVTYTGS